MNSPCLEREDLFAYALHLLKPAEEQKAHAHVEQCSACQRVVAAYRGVDEALGEWKAVEPSPWFEARARARVASAKPSASPFLGVSWRRWVAVAAVAVLIAVGGIRIFESHSTRTTAPVEAKAVPTQHAPSATVKEASAAAAPAAEVKSEIDLYKNLHVLENYDMLANFDVLSELPHPNGKVND